MISGSISIRFNARMYLDSKNHKLMCICMYIYVGKHKILQIWFDAQCIII